MKIRYLLYISAFILAPLGSQAQTMGCDLFFPGSEFLSLFEVDESCKGITSEADFCKCLNEDFKNNALKLALQSQQSPAEWKEENYKKNKENLLNIYSNLNYEMSFQESSFKMNKDKSKKLGCTPADIGEEFKSSLCNEYNDCGLAEGGLAIEAGGGPSLADCSKGDCTQTYKKINSLFKDRFKPYVVPDVKTGANSEGVGNSFGNSVANYNFKTGTAATTSALKLCSKGENDKVAAQEIVDKINSHLEKAKAFFTKYPELLVTTTPENLSFAFADCPNSYDLSVLIVDEYEAKKQFDKTQKKEAPLSQDLVESSLLREDNKIKERIAEGYKRSLPNACINYNTFKIISSAPQEELVNQWSKMNKEEILNSLDPKNLKQSNETFLFLKKNPTIAKNIVSPSQREKLAEKLHALSSKVQKQDTKQRLKSYMDFMRNDVAELNSKNKMMDILQCDLLAQNFAALASSEELPALGLEKGSKISSLANQYMACKMRDENQDNNKVASKPSMDEMIAANDFFSIYSGAPLITDPSMDGEYKDFLTKNCEGFEEFVEKDMSYSCLLNLNKEKCRKKLMDAGHSKRARLLKRYYSTHPEIKELSDIVDVNTEKFDIDDVLNKTNSSKQDEVAKSEYDRTIRPKLRNRSVYSTDNLFGPSSENKEIASAVNDSQESFQPSAQASATTGVSQRTESPTAPKISSPAPTLGQVTPSYLNGTPSYEFPKQLSTPNDFSEALSNLDSYSSEQKEEIIDQTKEFLAFNKDNELKKEELKKKIAEYEKAQEVALKNKESRSPASVSPAIKQNSSGTTAKITSAVPSAESSVPSSSRATLSSSNQESKAAASYSKALNQMNEKSSEDADKILVNQSSNILFDNQAIASSTFGESLVVDVPLESDLASFNNLLIDENAMKDYLLTNLKEISSEKIVSITCKGANCNPKQGEILLHVTKGANNSLIVRSVKMDTEVVRVHRVIDISRTINQELKSKQ